MIDMVTKSKVPSLNRNNKKLNSILTEKSRLTKLSPRANRDRLYRDYPDEWWDRVTDGAFDSPYDNDPYGNYSSDEIYDEDKYLYKQHQKLINKKSTPNALNCYRTGIKSKSKK